PDHDGAGDGMRHTGVRLTGAGSCHPGAERHGPADQVQHDEEGQHEGHDTMVFPSSGKSLLVPCEDRRMDAAHSDSPRSPESPVPAPGAGADGAQDPAGPAAGPDWLPGQLAELDAERPPRPPRGRLLAGLLSAALVIALLVWAL